MLLFVLVCLRELGVVAYSGRESPPLLTRGTTVIGTEEGFMGVGRFWVQRVQSRDS